MISFTFLHHLLDWRDQLFAWLLLMMRWSLTAFSIRSISLSDKFSFRNPWTFTTYISSSSSSQGIPDSDKSQARFLYDMFHPSHWLDRLFAPKEGMTISSSLFSCLPDCYAFPKTVLRENVTERTWLKERRVLRMELQEKRYYAMACDVLLWEEWAIHFVLTCIPAFKNSKGTRIHPTKSSSASLYQTTVSSSVRSWDPFFCQTIMNDQHRFHSPPSSSKTRLVASFSDSLFGNNSLCFSGTI